jgi:hypothetical protein
MMRIIKELKNQTPPYKRSDLSVRTDSPNVPFKSILKNTPVVTDINVTAINVTATNGTIRIQSGEKMNTPDTVAHRANTYPKSIAPQQQPGKMDGFMKKIEELRSKGTISYGFRDVETLLLFPFLQNTGNTMFFKVGLSSDPVGSMGVMVFFIDNFPTMETNVLLRIVNLLSRESNIDFESTMRINPELKEEYRRYFIDLIKRSISSHSHESPSNLQPMIRESPGSGILKMMNELLDNENLEWKDGRKIIVTTVYKPFIDVSKSTWTGLVSEKYADIKKVVNKQRGNPLINTKMYENFNSGVISMIKQLDTRILTSQPSSCSSSDSQHIFSRHLSEHQIPSSEQQNFSPRSYYGHQVSSSGQQNFSPRSYYGHQVSSSGQQNSLRLSDRLENADDRLKNTDDRLKKRENSCIERQLPKFSNSFSSSTTLDIIDNQVENEKSTKCARSDNGHRVPLPPEIVRSSNISDCSYEGPPSYRLVKPHDVIPVNNRDGTIEGYMVPMAPISIPLGISNDNETEISYYHISSKCVIVLNRAGGNIDGYMVPVLGKI